MGQTGRRTCEMNRVPRVPPRTVSVSVQWLIVLEPQCRKRATVWNSANNLSAAIPVKAQYGVFIAPCH